MKLRYDDKIKIGHFSIQWHSIAYNHKVVIKIIQFVVKRYTILPLELCFCLHIVKINIMCTKANFYCRFRKFKD